MYMKIDPAKLADAQTVADKLATLPRDALLYISGYVGGFKDGTNQQKTKAYYAGYESPAVNSSQ